MLYYLVYLSAATELYTDADLSQILTASRKNNTSKNITGILLYHEGNIIQVLEGDKETVDTLYHKIEADRRHKNVIRMVGGTIETRNFSDWSMGFKALTDKEWKECSGYLSLDPSAFMPALDNTNLKINTLLKSFVNTLKR